MKISRRKRQAAMESSALSDMAFLLIIYFIVIAGFNVNRGFLLNLPQKDSVKMVMREGLLRFRLDSEGRVLFEDRVVEYGEAEAEIRSAAERRPDFALVLNISPRAPWQSVVSFVDLARNTAADSFSFSMDKTETGKADR